MTKIAYALTVAISVGLSSTVYAGFGALNNLASSITEQATGVSSSNIDINGFFTQAKSTNNLFIQSRAALAYALASQKDAEEIKNKLNSLKTTSDLKEQQAIQAQITKLSEGVLEASKKDEANTVQQLANLNAEKRKLVIDSMTNFTIATLSARELALNSKQVSAQVAANPMSLSNSGLSLSDTKSLVGDISDIAKNSSLALIEYPKLLLKAGIEFKAPETSASKVKEVEL